MLISEENKNQSLFPHYAQGAIKRFCILSVSTLLLCSHRNAAGATRGSAGEGVTPRAAQPATEAQISPQTPPFPRKLSIHLAGFQYSLTPGLLFCMICVHGPGCPKRLSDAVRLFAAKEVTFPS